MQTLQIIAGISFDPGIRGILVVLVGVSVLMGSTYLILSTNLGARLGFLVAFTGLFGWLTILTFMWWLTPPAIGPRGNIPTWKPVEIYVNGGGDTAKTDSLNVLVDRNWSPPRMPVRLRLQPTPNSWLREFSRPPPITRNSILGNSVASRRWLKTVPMAASFVE